MLDQIEKLKREIGKVIVGRDKEAELLVISLIFNGHVLLESVPGTGKTLMAKTFAETFGGKFSRIQFTPDVLPSDITGIQFFNPKNHEFEFRPGPILANIVLADEINRATPRTQSSLLEAMEERQVTIDGHTFRAEDPFMVIATQNPAESQQGTFPLPAAQLDRFFMRVKLGYPSLEEERMIIKGKRRQSAAVKQAVSRQELALLREAAAQIHISEELEGYLLEIVRKTRETPAIELGVSPRGSLALLRAAIGAALIKGRKYAVPEDIKEMAPYVLAHRIYLTAEASLTSTEEEVIKKVIDSVEVPVEAGAR
ncbi:AAA family ATPase [Bacillus infantis]|uniref:AAA family ATPase n=1 Tax=Bacillus infantis TaxID=324767 RepID=UPI003CE9AE67